MVEKMLNFQLSVLMNSLPLYEPEGRHVYPLAALLFMVQSEVKELAAASKHHVPSAARNTSDNDRLCKTMLDSELYGWKSTSACSNGFYKYPSGAA